MKKLKIVLVLIPIFAFAIVVLASCNKKEVAANLVDSYATPVTVEGVPADKVAGNIVWVTHLKQKPYPYVYLANSEYAHYRAILK